MHSSVRKWPSWIKSQNDEKWPKNPIFDHFWTNFWKKWFSTILGRRLKKVPWESFSNTRMHWEMLKIDPIASNDTQLPQKPLKMKLQRVFDTSKIHLFDDFSKMTKNVISGHITVYSSLRNDPSDGCPFPEKGVKKWSKKCQKWHFSGPWMVFFKSMYLTAWKKNTTFGLLAHFCQNGLQNSHLSSYFPEKST